MPELSKVALQVDSNQSFPNNNNGYITPAILRSYNTNVIDSTVNQIQYTADSGSWNSKIAAINAKTGSFATTGSNNFIGNQIVTGNVTASFFSGDGSGLTGVLSTPNPNINAFTASQDTKNLTLASYTSSMNSYTASNDTKWSTLGGISGSFVLEAETGSFARTNANNVFGGSQTFNNIVVNGTASIAYLQAVTGSAKIIGDAFIILNNDTPTERYAGIIVQDSGSLNTTASYQFDGQTNDWFYSYSDDGGVTQDFGVAMFGPEYKVKGAPAYLSNNRIAKSSGSHHLNDSNISDDGTTVSINSNTSITGSLLVNGNAPLINANLTPLNSYTSSQDTKNSTLGVYTASVDTKFTTIGLLTGSYATTGSNNFKGVETIGDIVGVGTGEVYLLGRSGSLVIGANGLTPTYAALAHLSSSVVNSNVNLIIKNSTTAADTIISGSGNIFVNPTAPTTGFKRYIGTSNIYPHGNSIPQISGSMAWSPTTNGNIISHTQTNAVTWRGPVSSSASSINHNIIMGGQITLGTAAATNHEKAISGVSVLGNALFNGTISSTAFVNTLSSSVAISGNLVFGASVTLNNNSSSLSYASNVQNGGITVNNNYTPISGSGAGVLNARVTTNTIYGTGHLLNINGSNTAITQTKQFSYNILAGTFLTASVGDGDTSAILGTGIIGNGLIVTGSTLPASALGADASNNGQGSVFVGRYNTQDGSKSKTAETVFAVGTGTSYSNRKTGFLVDSGSNTYVEGTLNVSGGVFQNVVPLTITSQTASLDFSQGTFFTLTLADNTTTHIKPTTLLSGVSATLVITTGTNSSASLAPTMLQPSGFSYSATPTSGKIDLLSLVSSNSSSIFVVSTKNMI